ncbi:fatty-acid-binding protein 1 [Typha angustifolia]|uniref:fatty-acid-binding protein 1 n=1 Tax=Typha angustifolia TaxID=59011 RepID=UPI003C2C233D
MVSLRFPFSFPRPPRPPRFPDASRFFPVAVATGVGMALAISLASANEESDPSLLKGRIGSSPPIWASLSLADGAASGTSTEPKTGVAFPEEVEGGRRLLGVGLRRTNVFGLKSIDVYAFGVYVDDNDVKKLNEKYGTLSVSELKENKEFIADALECDLRMTVRLQIVYGRLSIRSVRNAFAKSVGSRLEKFGGSANKELLQRFVSLFDDEYKLPKGSVIELSREQGHVLQTKIDGKEVGNIQSKLLCQSILDLYFGEDPFDKRAKDDIQLNLASLLKRV